MYELMPPVEAADCEAFLLCSDGFWENVKEEDMRDTLRNSESAGEWLERMTNVLRINGYGRTMDNNSAIAVICGR